MKSILIDSITGIVLNMIVADPAIHAVPQGANMLAVSEASTIDQLWEWNAGQGFRGPKRYAIVDGANVESVIRVRVSETPSPVANRQVVLITNGNSVAPGWTWTAVTGFLPPAVPVGARASSGNK